MSVCKRCHASVATGLRFCGLCGTEVADPTSETVAFVTHNDDPLLAQMRLVLGGEYEIERECGRGGMAAVFKAMDVSLRRPVALKVMLPGASVGGAVAERLRREARRAAALDHPNIVPIYKVGEAGGIHYIVMKFIEGRPLNEIIEGQGALPISVVVAVLRATASALAYAHETGTIHRDIKSSNILVDQEGRVYVSDFGLARAAEDSKVTPSGAVVGTPSFMSPEQCSGAPVGPQGDQYSLGIVGFHMLAGTAPFEASSVLAVVQHHYFTPPPDLNKIRDDVPEALASIIRRCVEKNPARRFVNTSDLVTALETLPFQSEEQRTAKDILRRLARGYRVPIVQTGVLPPLPDARHTATAIRWASRLQPRVLLAIGLAVVMIISGGWIAVRAARPRPPALPPPSPAVAIPSPAIVTDTARPPRPPQPARPARPLPASPAPSRTAQSRSTGRVRLRTEPPDAVILIDGRQVGIGTVFDIEVPTGVRRLQIRAPGSVTFDTTFEVTTGNTTRLGLIALRNSP